MTNRVSSSKMVQARNISVETIPEIWRSDLLMPILAEDALKAAMVLESSFAKSNMQIGWPFLSLRPIQCGYCETHSGFGHFCGTDELTRFLVSS